MNGKKSFKQLNRSKKTVTDHHGAPLSAKLRITPFFHVESIRKLSRAFREKKREKRIEKKREEKKNESHN